MNPRRAYWSKKDLIDPFAKAKPQDEEHSPYIPEPLINDYNLVKWKNRDKPGEQKDDWVCVPEHMFGERFYGFIKMNDDEYEIQTTLHARSDR